jgi:hypothetical protein
MTSNDDLSDNSDPDGTESEVEPMGTFVVRTWFQPDQASGFRARLTYTQGLDYVPKTIATADRDKVLDIVRQWILAQPGS